MDMRVLKDVRYIPQLKRNLISIGALKALCLEVSIRDGVLKMVKDSMVILKGVRRNNLYYLKDSMVTRQVTTSTNSDYSRRCWVYTIKHKGEVLELFVE